MLKRLENKWGAGSITGLRPLRCKIRLLRPVNDGNRVRNFIYFCWKRGRYTQVAENVNGEIWRFFAVLFYSDLLMNPLSSTRSGEKSWTSDCLRWRMKRIESYHALGSQMHWFRNRQLLHFGIHERQIGGSQNKEHRSSDLSEGHQLHCPNSENNSDDHLYEQSLWREPSTQYSQSIILHYLTAMELGFCKPEESSEMWFSC